MHPCCARILEVSFLSLKKKLYVCKIENEWKGDGSVPGRKLTYKTDEKMLKAIRRAMNATAIALMISTIVLSAFALRLAIEASASDLSVEAVYVKASSWEKWAKKGTIMCSAGDTLNIKIVVKKHVQREIDVVVLAQKQVGATYSDIDEESWSLESGTGEFEFVLNWITTEEDVYEKALKNKWNVWGFVFWDNGKYEDSLRWKGKVVVRESGSSSGSSGEKPRAGSK